MPIQLSPSVVVQERDLTNVIPAVSASIGATIVDAGWGPVMDVTTIDSENTLVSRFGKPNNSNAASWFTAANFLAYASNLLVVRTKTAEQRNSSAAISGSITNIAVSSGGDGYVAGAEVTISAPEAIGGTQATAEVILGTSGEITGFLITDPGSGYTAATATVADPGAGNTPAAVGDITVITAGPTIDNETNYLNVFAGKSDTLDIFGEFASKYPGSLGNSISVSIADSASFSTWEHKNKFNGAPGTSKYVADAGGSNDELHMVVVDDNGRWTGTPGTVLELFAYASKAADAKKEDGTTAYYKTVLNNQSRYVWWMAHTSIGTNWGNDAFATSFATLSTPITRALSGGTDDFTSNDAEKIAAFELFNADEQYDLSLLLCGKASSIVANYVVQNVAEFRKDCVAFVSPQDLSSGDPLIGNTSDITEKLIDFRNTLPSSSYMVIDSGYKYQYDRYNDAYRWVPLNGDIAGLCARTDEVTDPWFSPAGLNRGQIKNVVRLGFNPRKTDRDNLYVAGINPVVSFPGQGVVLYGDKTGQTKPSAFDRINVRRLFIVLEKAIATAAKYQLFEFNDSFTQAQFRNMVEPFLRDVKGRRGVTDFKVVCDSSNNTGEVVDTNRFVADIYIKPARSINFIQLNFIATRTGAEFSEIAG